MTKIDNLDIIIDDLNSYLPDDLASLPRPRKRLTELMVQIANKGRHAQNGKKLFINFLRSPSRIERLDERSNRVHFGINEFVDERYSANSKVRLTDKSEQLDFGLLLRSIGYKAVSIDESIPIDERTGVIENEAGLIKRLGDDVFCSGWAATGANGVILGTMNSSFEIGRNILEHIRRGAVNLVDKPGRRAIMDALSKQNVHVITFEDWQKIDRLETEQGKSKNKPREKIVNTSEILNHLNKQ